MPLTNEEADLLGMWRWRNAVEQRALQDASALNLARDGFGELGY